MIVKPSKFKIILFGKLSSHEFESAVPQRDHQGRPPKTASYSLTTSWPLSSFQKKRWLKVAGLFSILTTKSSPESL